MERSFAIAILAVIHGLIFLILIAILLSDRWRRSRFRHRRLSKRESRIEQRLVSEAIAACVLEKDLKSLVRSLGRRAAEQNGFEDWIIWLKDDKRNFQPSGLEGPKISVLSEDLRASGEKQFFEWARINNTPMMLGPKAEQMASTEQFQKALRALTPALMIPFLDGEMLVGILLLGGTQHSRERRSEQYLTLFGAFAAILIRKMILDEEERMLKERQHRAENLASMGKVAAGVAHEIRNPLTFIRSAAEQLSESPGIDDDEAELTAGMIEEIVRINSRIEELRSLSRINTEVFAPVGMDDVLKGTVRLVEAKAHQRGVDIETDISVEEASVEGSADKLRQLFLNLMLNAIEAMPKGGSLRLGARAEGSKVFIEVQDTGGGIPSEIAERIFEPFYTTKEGGTGLGLAICYSIAGSHGGSVELADTGPEGTRFAVELPIISGWSKN
jgi:signal transduction histidine kinase